MLHSGYDEVDNIEPSESVRATQTEGKISGAVDFLIGGGLGFELGITFLRSPRSKGVNSKLRSASRAGPDGCPCQREG